MSSNLAKKAAAVARFCVNYPNGLIIPPGGKSKPQVLLNIFFRDDTNIIR